MKHLDQIENVVIALTMIITYHNGFGYTNIASKIGYNVLYNFFNKSSYHKLYEDKFS